MTFVKHYFKFGISAFLLLASHLTAFEKSVVLNNVKGEKLFLEGDLDDSMLNMPNSFHLKTTIENLGKEPIQRFRLNNVSEKEASGKFDPKSQKDILYQLLKLNQDKLIADANKEEVENPFHALNFCGTATSAENALCLARIASFYGITSKIADLKGHVACEYLIDNDWVLIDGARQVVYLNLDNASFAGTDEIIEDPFLALRTKPNGKNASHDIVQAWTNFAAVECVRPRSLPELDFSEPIETYHDKGYDLYPGDKLTFHHDEAVTTISTERLVTHEAVLNERMSCRQCTYHSATPIFRVTNQSNATLYIQDVDATVQPDESYVFTGPNVFELNLSCSTAPMGSLLAESLISQFQLPSLKKGNNNVELSRASKSGKVAVHFLLSDDYSEVTLPKVLVQNTSDIFDHVRPFFSFKYTDSQPDKIWWQISSKDDFSFILPNFDQVQNAADIVTVDQLSDTFFNNGEEYYFRAKALKDGVWGEWSDAYKFVTLKPEPVGDVAFTKVETNCYELSWQASEDPNTQYLIYASNSLDFLPSLYADRQIHRAGIEGISCSANNNFQTAISDNKLKVDGSYAFYRVIATNKGHYSTPSPLVYIFDEKLSQTRDILQINAADPTDIQRIVIPPSYVDPVDSTIKIPAVARSFAKFEDAKSVDARLSELARYAYNPNVSVEFWTFAQPFFLPENHPLKPKLEKMLTTGGRVTASSATLKKAKFKLVRRNHRNGVCVATHTKMKGYFFKVMTDDKRENDETVNFFKRIHGANLIRQAVRDHGYQHLFKVPHKWIYPIPPQPGVAPEAQKNFILISEDMHVYTSKANRKKWASRSITQEMMTAMYIIMQELGLNDCIHTFNTPLGKDGRIAFIDTEDYHKWPVYFDYMTNNFSKTNQRFWKDLIRK